jgi:hypothetical protein
MTKSTQIHSFIIHCPLLAPAGGGGSSQLAACWKQMSISPPPERVDQSIGPFTNWNGIIFPTLRINPKKWLLVFLYFYGIH